MEYITTTLGNLVHQTAFFSLTWGNVIMIAVACFFLFLCVENKQNPAGAGHQPGGQARLRLASTWKCRCGTLWPACSSQRLFLTAFGFPGFINARAK